MSQTPPKDPSLFCFFIIIVLLTPSTCLSTIPLNHEPKVKGLFVFGSSVVDNGNNNFLPNSLARADFLPYGIDFPRGTTGRFTNGRNIGDILGEKLKIPTFIPPFNDPSTKGSAILLGVNYASGGSGILDDTGGIAVNVTNLNQQIRNFEEGTLPDLEQQLGHNSKEFLRQCIFLVASGGNDYSLNYFLGSANGNVSVEEFTANLTATFSNQLEKLYSLGARKFVLIAINPNGCSPASRAMSSTGDGCVESLNRAFQLFNSNLKDLVLSFRPPSDLVFVNAYKIIRDIIRYPVLQGFRDVTNSCCEVIQISEGGTGISCKRGGSVCKNRSEYVFFDGWHTTEAVNAVVATKAFSSFLADEVYPFNVQKLSQI